MRLQETLKSATVLITSVVLSLGLTEAGLTLLVRQGALLDQRSDAYWIALSLSNGESATAARGSDTVLDEALGWRMKPMLERDGTRHNSLGFRGGTEHAERGTGPRILTIGDSFTYGLGVRDEETFAAQLGKLTKAEVINAGVNAYGVDQALLMWEQDGRRFKPEVVVLGYYVDDFYRNLLAVRDKPKPRFTFNPEIRKFDLQTTATSRDYADKLRQELGTSGQWRTHQAAAWLGRKLLGKLGWVDGAMEAGASLSEFLLRQLNDSVTRSGAKLIVVFIGHRFDKSTEHSWIEDSVAQSCRSLAVSCVNLAAAMRDGNASLFYGLNSHYSVEGHRFAADQIAQAIGPLP